MRNQLQACTLNYTEMVPTRITQKRLHENDYRHFLHAGFPLLSCPVTEFVKTPLDDLNNLLNN